MQAWHCLDTLTVMLFRGFLIRCVSIGNIIVVMFLGITILSALLCTHDFTQYAVQAPNLNKHVENNNEASYEETQPNENKLQIEYIPQDNVAEQMAQYQKMIENLKKEVKLIHERCKKTEIHLIGFKAHETNYHLEIKQEIHEFQERTRKLIQEELNTYDADKIGTTDFALEAHGGRIVQTVETEEYVDDHLNLWFYKLPLNTGKYSPRNIIQPWIEMGECWAFVGSMGRVVIELATLVQITGVTMEHISPKIALFGTIDSAPKEFTVLGMNESEVKENQAMELLGHFRYENNGEQRQTFWGRVSKTPYRFVMLWIQSNHGNTNYTCVHRFRVHGKPINIP